MNWNGAKRCIQRREAKKTRSRPCAASVLRVPLKVKKHMFVLLGVFTGKTDRGGLKSSLFIKSYGFSERK